MSSLVKAGKNLYKKASSFVHHIDPLINGVHKLFKKVWGSTVGRIAITAIAIYFGGWALGAWGGPSTLFGTSAAETATTAAGTVGGDAATAAAATEAAGTTAGTVGGVASAAPAASSTAFLNPAAVNAALPGASAATGAAGANTGLIASQVAGPAAAGVDAGSTAFLGSALPGGVSGGAVAGGGGSVFSAANIVSQIKSLGAVIHENPLVSAMALNAGAQALTPSPAQEAAAAQKDEVRRLNQNTMVGDVDVGSPTGKPLTNMDGSPVYGADGRPRANLGRNMGALDAPPPRMGLIESQRRKRQQQNA